MEIPLKRAKNFAACGALLLLLVTNPARAQQPSPDQISAIRASCRSDFMANCRGVTPGGKDALNCLEQNLAKLTGSCKAAVSVISPAPAATAAPAVAPAAALPSPGPAPTATQQPQIAAPPVGSNPPNALPATAPAPKPAPAPSKHTPTPPSPRPEAPAAPPTPPPAAAASAPQAPDVVVLPPRLALRIVRICAADQRALCANVPAGAGRIVACLMRNAPALSPPCKDALAQARP